MEVQFVRSMMKQIYKVLNKLYTWFYSEGNKWKFHASNKIKALLTHTCFRGFYPAKNIYIPLID